ncbi:stalk domain-containing protein [Paenibacillus sp. 1P07SE]|uniref:stalk domain-containing protein n=1 Tax=Paenibacillus sp. 1P07SE TaxID=3132209 RepID=UPI0039A51B71
MTTSTSNLTIRSKRLLKGAVAALLMLSLPAWGVSGAELQGDPLMEQLPLYEVRTLAGSGEIGLLDGASRHAEFRTPTGLAATSEGLLYVADTGNHRIRQVTAASTTDSVGLDLGEDEQGGLLGAWNDGDRTSAAFDSVAGLTIDPSGAIIIADPGNHAIRQMTPQGQVTTLAGDGILGLADGEGQEARFYQPLDVAVSQEGIIYVADTLNHVIRKIEQGRVTTLTAPSARVIEYYPGAVEAAGDYADGPIAAAKFNEPSGLAIDGQGNLYVSDTGNHLIRYIDFGAGTVRTVAGTSQAYGTGEAYAEGGYADGPAGTAAFRSPRGLALTPEGGLLIADSLNHSIRYLKDGVVHTVAGTPEETGKDDGLALYAALNVPTDIASLGDGAYAIADSGNNRIRLLAAYQMPEGLTGDSRVKLLYGDERIPTDADPIILSGTTFVPVRVLAERLGYQVEYEMAGRQIEVIRDERTYRLHQGDVTIRILDAGVQTTFTLNAAPFIQEGRLYLPVRFFAEELGLDVQWLPSSRSVLLRNPLF